MNIADKHNRGRAAAFTGLLPHGFRRRPLVLAGALTAIAACALAGCSAAGAAAAGPQQVSLSANGSMMAGKSMVVATTAGGLQALTLNDKRDVTFNQLLGINNAGVIVGYFGSGDAGHPNKGYALSAPYAQGDFRNENFPGAAQTQIIGINDRGISVGFFSPMNAKNAADNSNFGFWRANGRYHRVAFPTRNNSKPPINQLLGINDTGTAVGFYTDAKGNAHGYAYNIRTGRFKMIMVPGATAVTAAGINNFGTVTGFFTTAGGATDSFLHDHHGRTVTIAVPGASMTQAFGVSDAGEVVGAYTTGPAATPVSHGFTWKNGKFSTVDYPMSSATFINGVNDEGDIVGFYTDAKGNTDGFFGLP
jgi:uncharacterized membrane protein